MTVAELRESLVGLPDDAEVFLADSDCFNLLRSVEYDSKAPDVVTLR